MFENKLESHDVLAINLSKNNGFSKEVRKA